jgi:hypothetical protein
MTKDMDKPFINSEFDLTFFNRKISISIGKNNRAVALVRKAMPMTIPKAMCIPSTECGPHELKS